MAMEIADAVYAGDPKTAWRAFAAAFLPTAIRATGRNITPGQKP
jgi:hypothetical protein